MVVMSH